MKPDDVCAMFSESGLKIKIAELDKDLILLQGTREALLFLSDLLRAQAEYDDDDSFDISPFGPGNALFAPGSTRGIYISRVDSAKSATKGAR
jgi:hypothetical protein